MSAGAAPSAGPDHCFLTAPAAARPTRIWAIGDAGTTFAPQLAVRDAYYEFTGLNTPGERPTDVWLMLGDNAYEVGTDDEYQRAVFDVYGALLRRCVLWPTLGNHDAGSPGAESEFPFLEIFTLPRQGRRADCRRAVRSITPSTMATFISSAWMPLRPTVRPAARC